MARTKIEAAGHTARTKIEAADWAARTKIQAADRAARTKFEVAGRSHIRTGPLPRHRSERNLAARPRRR